MVLPGDTLSPPWISFRIFEKTRKLKMCCAIVRVLHVCVVLGSACAASEKSGVCSVAGVGAGIGFYGGAL